MDGLHKPVTKDISQHIVCIGPECSGMKQCNWLWHCTTSQKVVGLIPDDVTGICHWHNSSTHIMALELTEPVTENEYQEYFLGVKLASA